RWNGKGLGFFLAGPGVEALRRLLAETAVGDELFEERGDFGRSAPKSPRSSNSSSPTAVSARSLRRASTPGPARKKPSPFPFHLRRPARPLPPSTPAPSISSTAASSPW